MNDQEQQQAEINAKLLALREEVSKFPKDPGVYQMYDVDDQIIYIGKAKNLRARLNTYFRGGDGRLQIEFLLRRIHRISFILSASEEQAFILERDLINKHKPRYNIRLKDDKSYLSIRVDESADWPRLELVRQVKRDGARYYGPYTSTYELRSLMDTINKTIPLRTCADTVLYNRKRPCLEYQIKRCVAPCCLAVDRDHYKDLLNQALTVLEGKSDKLRQLLEDRMLKASDEMRFEDAAQYRDRIAVIDSFKGAQQFLSNAAEHRDVFALYRDQRLACLSVINVRYGRISNNTNFILENVEISDQDVLESALGQYYSGGREIPEEIIIPFELSENEFITQQLRKQRSAALEITVPKKGLKYRLLQLALLNARQHYISTFEAEDRRYACAQKLSEILGLKQIPRRIECVDISNLQGSDIVGAIVCFQDGIAQKSEYKKYKITQQGKPDDFASIYEVVFRRLKRGFEEDNLPDLLIIDGGKGQLQAACAARDELGIALDLVGLAKVRTKEKQGKLETKPERLFLEGADEAIMLEPQDAVTHFVARIRDEVHRYVISFHRLSRSKRVFASELDSIAGIGPERKRRLLKHFGSVKMIKAADAASIAKIGRMPLGLAEKILRGI